MDTRLPGVETLDDQYIAAINALRDGCADTVDWFAFDEIVGARMAAVFTAQQYEEVECRLRAAQQFCDLGLSGFFDPKDSLRHTKKILDWARIWLDGGPEMPD